MLNLSPEQRRFVSMDATGPIFLRGSAGSGKTTVAIYRAIAHAERGQRVLVLTHNRTLAAAMRTLIVELVGPMPQEITVSTLDRWLREFLGSRGHRVEIVAGTDRMALLGNSLRRVQGQYARRLEIDVDFLAEEFERMIKGQGISTENAYLRVARRGRKTALSQDARRAVWAVFQDYQSALTSSGKVEFADLPIMAESELTHRRLDSPFGCVIVDEAQDLTAAQLRVTRWLTTAPDDDLGSAPVFMVGDAAQSLRSRGFSWGGAGFATGRSVSLKTNIRNSKEIATAANALLHHNVTVTSDVDFVVPSLSPRSGVKPIVLQAARREQEDSALKEKILSLLEDQAVRLSDLAILCRTNEGCRQFVALLSSNSIPARHHQDAQFDILSDEVKVLTIDSAKGLEFPVVFIPRMVDDHFPYRHSDVIAPDDRQLAIDKDRTSLYVGMTRACEALYLVTSSHRPSRFLSEMSEHLWREYYEPMAKRDAAQPLVRA